jgi:hypothetical protein
MGDSTYCHMCDEYWEDCDCKTKPLHLTWHVFDVSGKRHNCPQRKQRQGAHPEGA